MIRIATLPFLILLSACGSWPDVPSPVAQGRDGAWPALVPLAGVLSENVGEETGQEEADLLAARAEALRRRAALLRTPVDDTDAFEALRARISG